MKSKLTVCIFLCGILTVTAFSQTKKMTATVSEDKGTTLPRARVASKGIITALTTNINGKFSFEIPATLKS